MIATLSVLIISFAFTYLSLPWFIPRLHRAGISGRDMNKEGEVKVAEMGGLSIIGGLLVGVLWAIGLNTFDLAPLQIDHTLVVAALATVLITAIIGIIDDLLLLSQKVKAVLPFFAALPLVAVKAGVTSMELPLIGEVDFGILYPLVLIPIAITGAANATNMLAGFNGIEAGLGVIMCATVSVIALAFGRMDAAIVSLAMLGALLAFLRYNWYPAKILIGDVGTLSIGAVVASSVIIGNIEQAGAILIIPFFGELILKARGRFAAQSWCKIKGGKLICPKKEEVYGLGRLVMHLCGGVSESGLVLSIMLIECLFAAAALYSYFGIPLS